MPLLHNSIWTFTSSPSRGAHSTVTSRSNSTRIDVANHKRQRQTPVRCSGESSSVAVNKSTHDSFRRLPKPLSQPAQLLLSQTWGRPRVAPAVLVRLANGSLHGSDPPAARLCLFVRHQLTSEDATVLLLAADARFHQDQYIPMSHLIGRGWHAGCIPILLVG